MRERQKEDNFVRLRDDDKPVGTAVEPPHNESSSEEKELFHGQILFRKIFGLSAILFLFLSITTESTITEEQAVEELMNRVSHSVTSGTTIETDAAFELDARNFEITGFDEGTGVARMLIWDFTGDSGNDIQILADGQVIREVHRLNSNVAAYSVPVPGVITIRGINSDGAEPITYAVKFPERRETLFNIVPVNGTNSYTLVPRF